jgi:hypothetical protein
MTSATRGRKPNRERHRQVAELRCRGWTVRAIGRLFALGEGDDVLLEGAVELLPAYTRMPSPPAVSLIWLPWSVACIAVALLRSLTCIA